MHNAREQWMRYTGQCRHEGKLAGHDRPTDGFGQLAGIGTGRRQVGPLHPHDVQAGRLQIPPAERLRWQVHTGKASAKLIST